MQETFLKAYAELRRFEGRAALGTWLHRIAANCAIDPIRRRPAVAGEPFDAEPAIMRVASASPGPDRQAAGREMREHVEAALADLTPLERAAFTLRHLEEQSIDEICGVLGQSPSATRHSIFRAVAKMRRTPRAARGRAAMNHIRRICSSRSCSTRRSRARVPRWNSTSPRASAAGRMRRSCGACCVQRRQRRRARARSGLRRPGVGAPRAAAAGSCARTDRSGRMRGRGSPRPPWRCSPSPPSWPAGGPARRANRRATPRRPRRVRPIRAPSVSASCSRRSATTSSARSARSWSSPTRRMTGTVDITAEQAWARQLLDANRLYRQSLQDASSPALADLLGELEPILLELVNSPSRLIGARGPRAAGPHRGAQPRVQAARHRRADACATADAASQRRTDIMIAELTLILALAGAGARVGASYRTSTDEVQSQEGTLYAQGTAALDKRDWDTAAKTFAQAATLKGERADAALYWRAYALHKSGRRDDALQSIAALRSAYPRSRWMKDAAALDLEIRQASGQAPPVDAEGTDDLKLMALGGLMNADPARALPLIKQMLARSPTDTVRDRAMFVLAQSGSPEARQVLHADGAGRRRCRDAGDGDPLPRAVRGQREPAVAPRHLLRHARTRRRARPC